MRRHFIFAIVLSLVITTVSVAGSDDGTVLAQFDYCAGYGMELLANDVNDNLLLLYNFVDYLGTDVSGPNKYSLHVVLLESDGNGSYLPANTKKIYEGNRNIEQLDWTYNPATRQFLIVVLDGQPFSDDTGGIKCIFVGIDGKRKGPVKTIPSTNIKLSFPLVTIVPADSASAPASAKFLFIGRGWNSGNDESGIAAVFLDNQANAIGGPQFIFKEKNVGGKIPTHYPSDLISNGEGGYLLASYARNGNNDLFLSRVLSLSGSAKLLKIVIMGFREAVYCSPTLYPSPKGKFVCCWVDHATMQFFNRAFTADLNKVYPARMASARPACTSDFDQPFTRFVTQSTSHKDYQFFVGDKSDMRVYQALLKKKGKVKKNNQVTTWDSVGLEGQYAFDRWFAVAPIPGTNDFYCAVVFREEDYLEVRGFVLGN